jgi:hypothetical protein
MNLKNGRMIMETIIRYKTIDGKMFDDEREARRYEISLIKNDFLQKLNGFKKFVVGNVGPSGEVYSYIPSNRNVQETYDMKYAKRYSDFEEAFSAFLKREYHRINKKTIIGIE